jgi:hypothetical protein
MHDDAKKLNETGGKLFEALTECILEDIYGVESITAQPSCDTMHIKPDILVGSASNPSHVVLVTHATAINNAGHKVDRGIEELFEIKTRFRGVPIAVNLIWHSPLAWSDGYLKRMDEMFDVNWVAFRDCELYESSLPEMIAVLDQLNLSESSEYHEIVRSSNLVYAYSTSVSERILTSNRKNAALWRIERSQRFSVTFEHSESDTSMGKDLVSLTAMRPGLLQEVLEKGRVKVDPALAQEIRTNVLRVRTLNGTFVSLEDSLVSRLEKASSFFGVNHLNGLLCDIATKRWATGTTVETADVAKSRIEQVIDCCESGTLLGLVDDSWDCSSKFYTARCWPLYVGVAIIKVFVDREFGFLNAQRRALGDTHSAFRWDLLNRYVRGEQSCLSRADLEKVVSVFQELIRGLDEIDAESVFGNKRYIAELELHRVKDENPLMLFVEKTLSVAKIDFEGWPSQGKITQCPFAVRAGLGAASGRTSWHFQIKDGRLLHVLSNYSSTHKDKEYCAKSRLSRYQWDGRKYDRSPVGEIGIILDGRWRSSETSMFSSAGIHCFPSDDPKAWIKWLKNG